MNVNDAWSTVHMSTTATAVVADTAVENVAIPGSDRAATARLLAPEITRLTGDPSDTAREHAEHLISLAVLYGTHPFTPLEQARTMLGLDRAPFGRLLEVFQRIPALRTAVERGPSGKYWTNTINPLNRAGALDAATYHRTAFPYSVGLYPGPTCMFRCHFCVRVTGARYEPSSIQEGNRIFRSVIDEVPTENRTALYFSGGLEPLTNPGIGGLVAHGASRGFDMTMYTNSFALTESTLARQPDLWSLGAIRTSLYGLDNDEYQATTTKPKAFDRVKRNLRGVMRMRAERGSQLRLGLNYIVLPGRADRLRALVDFVAELNEASPDRPLDFVTVREDYSGRDDGRLSEPERDQLRRTLDEFFDYARQQAPGLRIDLGYALESLRMGSETELIRIRPQTMRPTAHPQVAVQVDLLGDVYLYREAGFPELDGAQRYIAGRVTPRTSLREVVETFIQDNKRIEPRPGDEYFLDGFDQAVTARLNQLERDIADGWGEHRGFLRAARPESDGNG
ncbi:dTDP-4-amino-4,6-dideoxy-D-glucose ammonia-lyase [Streptomyces noursei]|uniref:dTDP-4-amino-4,6-dideoxy-D-glucose ammonia-lyase n=1 Tax=Streptomyces noursei TaxID=1971 RepID=UPI0033E957B7